MALSSFSLPCLCYCTSTLVPFNLTRLQLVSLKPYTRSQSQHTAAKAKVSSAPLVYSTRQGFDTVNIAEDVTQVLTLLFLHNFQHTFFFFFYFLCNVRPSYYVVRHFLITVQYYSCHVKKQIG